MERVNSLEFPVVKGKLYLRGKLNGIIYLDVTQFVDKFDQIIKHEGKLVIFQNELEDISTLIQEKKFRVTNTQATKKAHIPYDLPLKGLSDILITVHW